MSYRDAYASSRRDPLAFWADAARAVSWTKAFEQISIHRDDGTVDWFAGGQINTCYNAVDRHVENGRGDQAALIYDSAFTGTKRTFTFRQLQTEVARLAGALRGLGVGRGDRVLLYMPMVPEAVLGMLACARIGAVHSVVFGGFAEPELAKRIDDAEPKLVLSASCGFELKGPVPYKPLLDGALRRARHRPAHCVILQREGLRAALQPGRDIDWAETVDGAVVAGCVDVRSEDPLYILYTSGTTGTPKGIVRDNGGHLVALTWSMRHVYGVQPGDTFWAASDIGWVVGHSYIVYGPLAAGCTTILYEGKPVGTPDAGAYWRVVAEHGVGTLFTAPTALRAIKRDDPAGAQILRYDVSSLRHLFLAGERADPDSVRWAETRLGIPVLDHWWQTELGWPAAANFAGLESPAVRHGSAGVPVPGFDFAVLGDDGFLCGPDAPGQLVLRLPLPPGCLSGLWGRPEGLAESYLTRFEGCYTTGDAGFIDVDGYVHVMSRTDDLINVASHRLSTGAMEQVVGNHAAVAECAVVGVRDELKGTVPLAFVVLFPGVETAGTELQRDINDRVRAQIGPIATLKAVVPVKRLPKTRSGKILRGSLRAIVDREPSATPATIEDPAVLDEVAEVLRGYKLVWGGNCQ